MELPASRMRVVQSHEGRKNDQGWLKLDLRGLELEGVSHLYVDLSEVERIKQKADEAASMLDAWAEAFGEPEA